jgi:hypothetical protein
MKDLEDMASEEKVYISELQKLLDNSEIEFYKQGAKEV